jgi:large subunit ribosomal protein L15
MSLFHTLKSISHPEKKRIGRGIGSGQGGHTSTRGTKGQKARTGVTVPLWFEGGQLPLIKRMPMWRGKGRFNVVRPTAEITLSDLEAIKADTVSLETLKIQKLIDARFKKAKIIATGTLSRAVTIQGIPATKAAAAAIVAAGGTIVE